MNLNLTLPKELGDRLALEAQRRGLAVEHLAADLIARSLPAPNMTCSPIRLLQEWDKQDEQLTEEELARHRATLQAIDADRLSERKLFEELSEQEANRNGEADPLAIATQRMVSRIPEQILADREEILKTVRPGRALPPGKTLFDVVEGTWPGDETDAQIREALEKMS